MIGTIMTIYLLLTAIYSMDSWLSVAYFAVAALFYIGAALWIFKGDKHV